MQKINLVEVKSDDDFEIDMMYAKTQNMMQTDVYSAVGMGNRCFVQPDLWECLQNLRPILQTKGLKLKICDAYRPPLAFDLMKKITPMEGFFAATAERSQHCHASAIDVTLLDKKGVELDFPCAVDAYEEKYALQVLQGKVDEFYKHLEKAKYSWNAPEDAEKIKNREMLRQMMENVGLAALEHEWWHFNLPNKEKYPLVNSVFAADGSFQFFI